MLKAELFIKVIQIFKFETPLVNHQEVRRVCITKDYHATRGNNIFFKNRLWFGSFWSCFFPYQSSFLSFWCRKSKYQNERRNFHIFLAWKSGSPLFLVMGNYAFALQNTKYYHIWILLMLINSMITYILHVFDCRNIVCIVFSILFHHLLLANKHTSHCRCDCLTLWSPRPHHRPPADLPAVGPPGFAGQGPANPSLLVRHGFVVTPTRVLTLTHGETALVEPWFHGALGFHPSTIPRRWRTGQGIRQGGRGCLTHTNTPILATVQPSGWGLTSTFFLILVPQIDFHKLMRVRWEVSAHSACKNQDCVDQVEHWAVRPKPTETEMLVPKKRF